MPFRLAFKPSGGLTGVEISLSRWRLLQELRSLVTPIRALVFPIHPLMHPSGRSLATIFEIPALWHTLTTSWTFL